MTPDTPELRTALARLDVLTNWEASPRATMRQGLEAISSLLMLCGDPHARMRFVHVTGTKGKGSVCALVEHALIAAGVAVGRYASPHLESVTERVSIRGRPVDDDMFASSIDRVVDQIVAARGSDEAAADATWFDAITAAALLAFQATGCAWVILEVGLGGRFDSTNAAAAEIAVVTNVELEHTEVLGRTRREIAFQKAGIIKSGAVVVTPLDATDEAGQVVHAEAAAVGASVHLAVPRDTTIAAMNLAIAGAVLDQLCRAGVGGQGPTGQSVGRGLLTADVIRAGTLPGRMERFSCRVNAGGADRDVTVILDGAHVPFNLAAVLRDLAERPDSAGPCVAVVSIGEDKDAAGLLAALAPRVDALIFTTLPPPARLAPPDRLARVAASQGLGACIESCAEHALHAALHAAARRETWVLVTGSLHLAGALRPLLTGACATGRAMALPLACSVGKRSR